METECFVRLVDLPWGVRGFTTPNDDGSYNIYLNSRLTRSELLRAERHERRHVELGHFQSELPAEILEREADGKPVTPFFVARKTASLVEFVNLNAIARYYNKVKCAYVR